MIDQVDLRKILETCFNEEELKNLCSDLEIDYERFSGHGKTGTARELVDYCKRHSCFLELVKACYRLRPHVFKQLAEDRPLEPPRLSLPNLLNELEWPTHYQTTYIKNFCHTAKEHIAQGEFEQALKEAESAEERSDSTHNPSLQSIALLYRSLARWSSGLPQETQKAISDCDGALTHFRRRGHNGAIALIFRAQLDRQMEEWDDSLFLFEEARKVLGELRADCLKSGSIQLAKANDYKNLRDDVTAIGLQVLVSLPPDQPYPKRFRRFAGFTTRRTTVSEHALPLPDLEGPTLLMGPGPKTVDVIVVLPVSKGLEISQISIDGKPYAVHADYSSSKSVSGLRLRGGQRYMPIQKAGRGDTYILMRVQDKLDQFDQKVVVFNATTGRIWMTSSPKPRIIGGPGEPLWPFRDEAGNIYYDKGRMLGVVEGLLTPIGTGQAPGAPH